MIYTRNKQSFKTKTIKSAIVQPTIRQPTISQNGYNLVEELKQRIQNKNRKNSEVSNQNNSVGFKTEESSKKQTQKITISKISQKPLETQDPKKTNIINQNTSISSEKTDEINCHSFAKVNKNPFLELSGQPQSLKSHSASNQNKNISPKSHLPVSSELIIVEDFRGSIEGHGKNGQGKYEELRQIYESPIHELNQQNYFSNGQKQPERKISDQNYSNKQKYQQKVSKWKSKINLKKAQQYSFSSQITKIDKPSQTNTQESCNTISNAKDKMTRPQLGLKIFSGILFQTVLLKNPQTLTKNVSAKDQYIQLLQGEKKQFEIQVFDLKRALQNSKNELGLLKLQNESFKKENLDLKTKLQAKEIKLSQLHLQNFITKKLERLVAKMRNLLIVNAMQLIQTKNFLSSTFQGQSLAGSLKRDSSPQNNNRFKISRKIPSFIQTNDYLERIHSMNESIARVEQTVQVSQKVLKLNSQRLSNQASITEKDFSSQFVIRQFEETILYKDKIIQKLKEQINILKSDQKPSIKQKDTKSSFPKPYTYVDEIHLLRHEINRLTQQNLAAQNIIIQTRRQLNELKGQNEIKYPNQSRIRQIQSIINQLSKPKGEQNNSKVQYWVQGKTCQKSKNTNQTAQMSRKTPQLILFEQLKPFEKPHITEVQEEVVTKKLTQKYSTLSKKQTVQFQKVQFSQLVQQFKSNLSGLTPQKKSIKELEKQNKNNQDHLSSIQKIKQISEIEIIQLPTFRTPTHEAKQALKISKSTENNQNLHQKCLKTQQNMKITIQRLEYEKQFLQSERQALQNENKKLIEELIALRNEPKDQKSNFLTEEIYKLQFQNQQLVDRVVNTQNLLQKLKHSKSQSQSVSSSVNFKQKSLQIQKLTQENKQLRNKIEVLNLKNQELQLSKNASSQLLQHDPYSYVLAPSFEALIKFLKKLPEQNYHKILLKLIQGYERKVSQLREENVLQKTMHKQIQDLLMYCSGALEKIDRFLNSQLVCPINSGNNQSRTDIYVKKLSAQVQKTNRLIQQALSIHFEKNPSMTVPLQAQSNYSTKSTNSSSIQSLSAKVNYHLMLLRSFIQGIGQADLELIESELSDYLKQLKNRIPTVLQSQQFQESCHTSLNASMTQQNQPFEE